MSTAQSSGPYRVLGADSRSGRDVVVEVTASTPAEASAFANRMGLLVSSVERSGERSDETPAEAHPAPRPNACRCCGASEFGPDRLRLFGNGAALCGLVSQGVGGLMVVLAIVVTLRATTAADLGGPPLATAYIQIVSILAMAWAAFAVGFLLAAPKKVWRCLRCSGVVSERV